MDGRESSLRIKKNCQNMKEKYVFFFFQICLKSVILFTTTNSLIDSVFFKSWILKHRIKSADFKQKPDVIATKRQDTEQMFLYRTNSLPVGFWLHSFTLNLTEQIDKNTKFRVHTTVISRVITLTGCARIYSALVQMVLNTVHRGARR